MDTSNLESRRAALREFLAERDVACPACGYNLRGLASERCPECRQQLELDVTLAEPPIVPYGVALVGLAACGAGFGLMVLAVVVISLAEGRFPDAGEELIMLLFAPVAIVLADAAAVRVFMSTSGRRWFRTRSQGSRWVTAAGCWAASVGVMLVWILVLFRFM